MCEIKAPVSKDVISAERAITLPPAPSLILATKTQNTVTFKNNKKNNRIIFSTMAEQIISHTNPKMFFSAYEQIAEIKGRNIKTDSASCCNVLPKDVWNQNEGLQLKRRNILISMLWIFALKYPQPIYRGTSQQVIPELAWHIKYSNSSQREGLKKLIIQALEGSRSIRETTLGVQVSGSIICCAGWILMKTIGEDEM